MPKVLITHTEHFYFETKMLYKIQSQILEIRVYPFDKNFIYIKTFLFA